MIEKLRKLDPTAIQFHADRYDSAEQFQHMILHALDGSLTNDEIPDWVAMIAEDCIHDGADWGNIPCLADPHLSVWKELLEQHGTEGEETYRPEFFGEGFQLRRW